jgi:hypothetical protein
VNLADETVVFVLRVAADGNIEPARFPARDVRWLLMSGAWPEGSGEAKRQPLLAMYEAKAQQRWDEAQRAHVRGDHDEAAELEHHAREAEHDAHAAALGMDPGLGKFTCLRCGGVNEHTRLCPHTSYEGPRAQTPISTPDRKPATGRNRLPHNSFPVSRG